MALEAQNNPFTSVLLVGAADPEALPDADPSAGSYRFVIDDTGAAWIVDSTGTATAVSGGSGDVATDAIWDAAGDIVQGTGANAAAKLGAGTAGHVLTSNGAAAAVSWQAPSGGSGALVLLEQHTASASASLDFTTFISSTYDEYLIEGVGVVPATNAVNLVMRVGTGGGPTYDTTNYNGSLRTDTGHNTGAAKTNNDAPGASFMVCKTIANNAGYGQVSFSLRLTNPQSTSLHKHIYGMAMWHDGSEVYSGRALCLVSLTTALTAVQFFMSSGNIASGVIRAYGVAK